MPADLQIRMILEVDRLLDRSTLWLLRHSREQLRVTERVREFGEGVAAVIAELESILPAQGLGELTDRMEGYQQRGVPGGLSRFIASVDVLGAVLDIVAIARGNDYGPVEVARVYFLLGSRFRLDWLRDSTQSFADQDPWHKAAAEALTQDLIAHQGQMTRDVLQLAAGRSPQEATEAWLAEQAARVEPIDRLLAELEASAGVDFAMLAVANHQLRLLAASPWVAKKD